MSRLTTNKPVDEMSMLELVYNSCCVSEDGSAMYKDFETVRDARDFVRNLYKVHLNEEMPTDDDIFDESMIDELQYEPEVHLNGLIALFYRNLWAMADLRETLKAYEDKEEQGLLISLPCKVGDTVHICLVTDIKNHDLIYGIFEAKVTRFILDSSCLCFEMVTTDENKLRYEFAVEAFGKTVFLKHSEAEEALARMKGE